MTTRSHARSEHTSIPLIASAMVGLLMVFGLIVILLPVHTATRTLELPQIFPGESVAAPANMTATRIRLELTVVAGGDVHFTEPTNARGIAITSIDSPTQDDTTDGDHIITLGGTPLVIDVSSRAAHFFLSTPDPGAQVQITASSDPALSDPALSDPATSDPAPSVSVVTTEAIVPADGSPIPVTMFSGASIETQTQTFWLDNIEIVPGKDVQAWIGPLPLDISTRPDGTAFVDRWDVIRPILGGVWSAALSIGAALVLLTTFALFGWAVLRLIGVAVPDPFLGLAMGVALPGLVVGGLNYVLPAREASLIVAIVVWITIGLGLGLGRPGGRWRVQGRSAVDALRKASLGGPLILTLVAVGFPVALTHSTNLGLLETDIYDYLHVQRAFWDTSIINAGLDWGDGLRTIDGTVRSALDGWTPLSAMESVTAVRFLTIMVALACVGGAAKALGASRRRTLLIQVMVGSIASIHSLWTEGYLSREMFVWMAIAALATATIALAREDAPQRSTWFALGAIFAWPSSLVPPFMVVFAAVAVGALAGIRSTGWRNRIPSILAFCASFVPLTLINFRWVLNTAKANEYAQAVEGIGKFGVLPFHAKPEMAASVIGITGFHTNPGSWQGPKTIAWLPQPVEEVVAATNTLGIHWLGPIITGALILALFLGFLGAEKAVRRPLAGLFATAVVTLVGFLVVLTRWETQSYFVLMWAWTLSPFVLAPLMIGAAALRDRTAKIVLLGLALIAGFNMISTLAEISIWFGHPNEEAAEWHHYDIAGDVLRVQQLAADDQLPSGRYRIELPTSDITRTDDERVEFNLVELVLTEENRTCVNCNSDTRNGSVASINADDQSPTDFVVFIGGWTCRNGEPYYRGITVAVCPPGLGQS